MLSLLTYKGLAFIRLKLLLENGIQILLFLIKEELIVNL
jgi:hypothetical protein